MNFLFWFFSLRQEVNMNLAKFDELDVLIKGILFAETHNPTECYYFENASKIEYVLFFPLCYLFIEMR